MSADVDAMAKKVMQSPAGLKIITGLDKFNTALSSQKGKEALSLISSGGGDSLKSAAAAAVGAPKDSGRVFISTMLSSKDGAALVGKIIEMLEI